MAHYGTLHDFEFKKDVDDIRGTAVYGSDNEKLGKIEDVVFDHETGEIKYVVIDSGGWFKHKLFLVPANRIHAYEKDKDAFQVDLVKDQIEKDFPAYDRDKMKTEQDFMDYEDAIAGVWVEDVVMHRGDRLDLNITPERIEPSISSRGIPMGSLGEEITPEVAESARGDIERQVEEDIANRDLTPHRLAGEFPGPTQKPDLAPDFSDLDAREVADLGQWHPRMKRFEDVLRKNRVDVTASCASCAPARDKAA